MVHFFDRWTFCVKRLGTRHQEAQLELTWAAGWVYQAVGLFSTGSPSYHSLWMLRIGPPLGAAVALDPLSQVLAGGRGLL